TIGRECVIGPHAVLGGPPQDVGYKGQSTFLEIGNRNVIREYVSIHRASREGEATVLGDDNYIMAYSHVGHDCRIGSGVVITSYAGISGHVVIEDLAVIGGQVGFHQFVRVGTLAMVGGNSAFNKDIPPYTMASGRPGRVFGLNVVGLRRKGISSDVRRALSRAFKLFYRSGLNVSQALEKIRIEVEPYPEVLHFVEFIRASRRGVCAWSMREKGRDE
ncbi:MAG: acyl-[acyl-carrier-protein]--UDP-N-acetylglucosamine O-acyltransferase, partial [Aquificota bacterium]